MTGLAGTDSFYSARKQLIEKRLEELQTQPGRARALCVGVWLEKFGQCCQGVNWERNSLEELLTVIDCVGGTLLAVVCRRLAEDYTTWTGGMPDLLLWQYNATEGEGSSSEGGKARLVEVKGPRDRLSEQQRAWLLTLAAHGWEVEVLKVVEEEEQLTSTTARKNSNKSKAKACHADTHTAAAQKASGEEQAGMERKEEGGKRRARDHGPEIGATGLYRELLNHQTKRLCQGKQTKICFPVLKPKRSESLNKP